MNLEKIRGIQSERDKLKLAAIRLGELSQEQISQFLEHTNLRWLEAIRRQAIIDDSFGLRVTIPDDVLRDSATGILRAKQGCDPMEGTYRELSRSEKTEAWKIQDRFLRSAEYNVELKARDRSYFDKLTERHGQHAVNCLRVLEKILLEFENHYFERRPETGDANFIWCVLAFHLWPLPVPSRKFVKNALLASCRDDAWRYYEWVQGFWADGVDRLLQENIVEVDLSRILDPIKKAQELRHEPVPDGEIPSKFRVALDKNQRVHQLVNEWKELNPLSDEKERRRALLDALEREGKWQEAEEIKRLWEKS